MSFFKFIYQLPLTSLTPLRVASLMPLRSDGLVLLEVVDVEILLEVEVSELVRRREVEELEERRIRRDVVLVLEVLLLDIRRDELRHV